MHILDYNIVKNVGGMYLLKLFPKGNFLKHYTILFGYGFLYFLMVIMHPYYPF